MLFDQTFNLFCLPRIWKIPEIRIVHLKCSSRFQELKNLHDTRVNPKFHTSVMQFHLIPDLKQKLFQTPGGVGTLGGEMDVVLLVYHSIVQVFHNKIFQLTSPGKQIAEVFWIIPKEKILQA